MSEPKDLVLDLVLALRNPYSPYYTVLYNRTSSVYIHNKMTLPSQLFCSHKEFVDQ